MKKLLAFTILTFALQACGDKTQRNENAESEKVEEVNTIENKKSISSDSERSRDTEFENEIVAIVNAFKNKDGAFLNRYIDAEIGFYIIPGAGTLRHFEKVDSLDFKDPQMEYHPFGKPENEKYKVIYTKKSPEYSCESQGWNRYGLFVISGKSNVFSNILYAQEQDGWDISTQDRTIADKVDAITQTVFLTQKDSDIVFGISRKGNKYILTYLDLNYTYCDI